MNSTPTKGDKVRVTLQSGAFYEGILQRNDNKGVVLTNLVIGDRVISKRDRSRRWDASKVKSVTRQ